MLISVNCRCAVERQIDTEKVGPWRLRCKGCQEIIYDPEAQAQPKRPDPEPSTEEESQFNQYLRGSAELKVLMSSEQEKGFPSQAGTCRTHQGFKIVAACNRCSKLLCRRCLDRVGDSFTCASCIEKQLLESRESGGGFLGFFKRLFFKTR
jgi:hypothetical protein